MQSDAGGVERLERRVIVFVNVVFSVRDRDEGSLGGRTQPLRRGYGVGCLLENHQVIHRDSIGGLLENHRACRDCWLDPEVDSCPALLVFSMLQTTSEISSSDYVNVHVDALREHLKEVYGRV